MATGIFAIAVVLAAIAALGWWNHLDREKATSVTVVLFDNQSGEKVCEFRNEAWVGAMVAEVAEFLRGRGYVVIGLFKVGTHVVHNERQHALLAGDTLSAWVN